MAAKLVPPAKNISMQFEESDTDEDELIPGLSRDEIKSLFEERSTQQLHSVEHPPDMEAENIVEDLNKKIEELTDCDKRSCAHCSNEKRVEDMSYLQRGQHISHNGDHFKIYFNPMGKQVSFYRHHAIIKDVIKRSRHTAEVVCIHFSKDKQDQEIKVLEETCIFDLAKDELYVTEYQHPRYTPDVIIQRAESILRQSKDAKLFKGYSILNKNCEHFATWCVVGKEESFQVRNFLNDSISAVTSMFGTGSKIARLILQILFNSSDEITSAIIAATTVPIAVLGGCSAAYLVYCIIRTVCLIKQYHTNKEICKSCLKGNLLDLWLQFGVFGVTSAISFVIFHFALQLVAPGFGIPIAIVLGLLSTALILAVPKIRRALQSPFQCDAKDVTTLSELKPGDAVSLTYYGFKHLILVSKVKFETDPKQGTLRGIHYSLPGFFSQRVIAEEDFQVDLTKSKVMVLQLEGFNTFSPELRIDRARKRIGERMWRISSNSSDHLCYWAMIKTKQSSKVIEYSTIEEIGNSSSLKLSSLSIGEADVHLIDEINVGDVVEYGSDKGIVVALEDIREGRLFYIDIVVHKGLFKPFVMRISHKIDLNMDNLVVHKYHPARCVSREERVQKALDRINKPSKFRTQTGFIEDILKHQSG
ncbi:hypothetical protein CHS0354_002296 [Potamilus streckersoni]|uniref:LRAT domain-containing protein n=1 Tax=Potamilus streckersoni TaxID=2493646 RepID=A0AAE0SMV8_9BIVA|nr:hypothetical protein CHS0354_002296 [Potamilus streckersoni]